MATPSHFAVDDRVRIIRACPGTHIGDEGRIMKVVYNDDGTLKGLEVLIDSNPATTHGTTLFPDDVEHAA